MAAGITVERARLGDLRAYFETEAAAAVEAARRADALRIDGAISAEGATLALIEEIERAGPYGTGHPQPILVMPFHRITGLTPVGNGHLRLQLMSQAQGRAEAIAFRARDTDLGRMLAARRGALVHVAGTLSANSWNGRTTPQFRVIDAAVPA